MGTLHIVATPIGNLDDITIRAIKTIFSSDVLLCEDSRRTGILLKELSGRWGEAFDMVPEASPKLIPYYDEVEEKSLPAIIGLLEEGKDVSLVSDAGTPLISDPGFRLVRECAKRDIKVESIPGPSAVLAALTSSGLPSDKFLFLGYPPEKHNARKALFDDVVHMNRFKCTITFYCAPHKLMQTLEDMEQSFGNIYIVIARELTKIHEEVWRGKISEARSAFTSPKGEMVLLISLPS